MTLIYDTDDRIDIPALLASVDLLTIVGRDVQLKRVAVTRRGVEYAGACPWCGGTDRFRVTDQGKWWCRQCSRDERWDNAIRYIMKRDGLGFRDAAEHLASGVQSGVFIAAKSTPKLERVQDMGWHTAASVIASECQTALWSNTPQARGALNWLHARGLNDTTLKAWRIGLSVSGRRIEGLWTEALWIESGVTIPYYADGLIYAINVRRPDLFLARYPDTDKYRMMTGSRRVLFGADHLVDRPDVVITEGEFDVMLVWQEAGDLVDSLTMGAATVIPSGKWLDYLMIGLRYYIATDNDEAGNKSALKWMLELGQRGLRRSVPDGKDVTEFWQRGGGVREWITRLMKERG